MNGYHYETTGVASLAMCEHIKPDQMIVVASIRKPWPDFKIEHADWNFDPELCRKNGMKFVVTNTQRSIEHMSYHYILLLDGSG
jgi:hypothetical protein